MERYPEIQPDKGTLDYFKANPNVAGMAVGEGLNGYSGARSVMVNPYTKLDRKGREGLLKNERLRHFLSEGRVRLKSEPTAEQLKFFGGTEYGKPENREELKSTLLARILTGDDSAGNVTDEQVAEAQKVDKAFQTKDLSASPVFVAYQMSKSANNPLLQGRVRVPPNPLTKSAYTPPNYASRPTRY